MIKEFESPYYALGYLMGLAAGRDPKIRDSPEFLAAYHSVRKAIDGPPCRQKPAPPPRPDQ